jgi:hypothetical protein
VIARWAFCAAAVICAAAPSAALAWGYEGHEIIADIARGYLTRTVRSKVDAMLAADSDNTLTAHDMAEEATWADRWRSAGHRETASWHFTDEELDHPDLTGACFGFPAPPSLASQGPAQDCLVDKVEAFSKELGTPSTPAAERLAALKYLLHFVGDLHQPLHASENHDRGGNCVLLSLGGPRSVNLHSYWDTTVVQALGDDPSVVGASLAARITPAQRMSWERGDVRAWQADSYAVAKASVYTIRSRPGCDRDQSPISLPADYANAARATAAVQLQKAGVRLALVLNRALGPQ